MPIDLEVNVFYGPLAWYEDQLGSATFERLPDRINELDQIRRTIRHWVEGQQSEDEETPGLTPVGQIVAMSGDYSSIQEHAVNNFVGLVRDLVTERLYLHNPPQTLVTQLKRVTSVTENFYEYPAVTKDVLLKFRDQFAKKLIGQTKVRRRMLAALYPLTTPQRQKPVVVMFYGPSGVGKTETAQFINELLGGQLMRKQFSMFQNENFASYIFGASHYESSFARDLLDRSSGVILLDEFDKANAVFHSAFYEMFDDGIFVDKNYRVSLGSSLIICTSNYANETEIQTHLGDALFSRFDALIGFDELSPGEVTEVMGKLITARFDLLSPLELELVDREDITSKLLHADTGLKNVRTMKKLVDEVVSIALVDSLLDGEPQQPHSGLDQTELDADEDEPKIP